MVPGHPGTWLLIPRDIYRYKHSLDRIRLFTEKSRIRETPNLSTDADRSTNTERSIQGHSAVQCSTEQCSAVQWSAVQCSAVQCTVNIYLLVIIYQDIIIHFICNLKLRSSIALSCTALQVQCISRRAPVCSALHYMTQTALHFRN